MTAPSLASQAVHRRKYNNEACARPADRYQAANGPVRLEFPILSLNPGSRQRCVASGLLQRGTQRRVVEGPHAVDLRRRTHGGPCRAEQCPLDLPLPGLGPAPSGGLTTNSRRTGDDATTGLDLLTAVEGPLVRVTADAAYDTVAVYETAGARGATVVVPPARTANVSGHGPRSPARDRTITLVKTLGRRRWKKASGYHRQGRVENAFFRYTSIIGDGLRARSPAGQGSEAVLGCEILNRMTALGRPASYRIGR